MTDFPVKSIGIVGNGVVGSATARAYLPYCQVLIHDVIPGRSPLTLDLVLTADLIFVCLPTPQKAHGLELDISAVYEFVRAATKVCDDPRQTTVPRLHNLPLVIKSTLPIGTTRDLAHRYDLRNVVYSPEFLSERTADIDAVTPARNIIGVPGYWDISHGFKDHVLRKCRAVYETRFPGVQVMEMDSSESEAVKLITNGFFATKIAFFNEMYQLCKSLGLDWDEVMDGVLSDGRIAHSHTRVPGPDGKFGFGGKCLPKDLAQLLEHVESTYKYDDVKHPLQSEISVVDSVHGRNRDDRNKS